MNRKMFAAFVPIVLIAGCATYGEIEDSFGKSFVHQKKAQILNPQASQNLNPVTGLPGAAGEAVGKQYIEQFSREKGKDSGNGSKKFTVTKDPTADSGSDRYGK